LWWLYKRYWCRYWCLETESSSFYWAHLSRFRLKTEAESGSEMSLFQMKDRKMDTDKNNDSYNNTITHDPSAWIVH
jgi:hypothetical protein